MLGFKGTAKEKCECGRNENLIKKNTRREKPV